jgi:TonB-linked SusC/RagA family outer membrane protein
MDLIRSGSLHAERRPFTKLLMVMKLTAFLMLVFCLQVSANVFSQKVTLNEKNASLQKVFKQIHRQTGYQFFYEDELLDRSGKVDVQVTNMPLEEALKECFKNLPLSFKVINKTIVVNAKPPVVEEKQVEEPLPPPPPEVRGLVINEKGEPVEGVSVMVKGTQKGAVTNANGLFSLSNLNDNDILVFTSVNIETQEIALRGRTTLSVFVKSKVSPLDDIQVIGYGKTTQRLSTSSVSSVKSDVIEKQPVANPIQAIQGRMAGVSINQTSGAIGSGMEIQIRGIGTIASANQPLIIVDGAIMPDAHNGLGSAVGSYMSWGSTSMNSINPADIESIDILKDADATAIYGSRGANGVVLITTKKGKMGPTRVNAEVSTWVNSATYLPPFLNLQDYRQMRRDAFAMGNHNPITGVAINPIVPNANSAPDLLVWDSTKATTDWQEFEYGNSAPAINAQISLSGGEKRLNFFASAGYLNQRDITRGSPFQERISTNLALNHSSANDRLKASFSMWYTFNKLEPSRGGGTGGTLQGMPPNMPMTNPDGSTWWPAGNITQNALLVSPNAAEEAFTTNQLNNFTGNLDLSYRIIKGLTAKALFGYNNQQGNTYRATPSTSINPLIPTSTLPGSTTIFNNFSSINFEPQLNYNGNLSKGKIDVLLGSTFFDRKRSNYQLNLDGYTSDLLLQSWAAASSVSQRTNSSLDYRFNSIFSRVNYNWQNKYIANLTYRRDGSSRFGPNNRYGNFWAIGGAWLFTNEDFMKNLIPGLSFGKLRAGYGKTGNDNIQDYRYTSLYSSALYNGVPGLAASYLADSSVRWETSKKLDVALELGFLKDRFIFNANWFKNQSTDLLITNPIAPQTGFQNFVTNIPAVVENTGWEFEFTSRNLPVKSKLQWRTTFNLTLVKNRLTEFPGLANSSFVNRLEIGKPINNPRFPLNAEWTWVFEGINPDNGLPIFADKNRDGVINNLDRVYVGSTIPRTYGGLGNTLNYKGFELDFLFQFSEQMATTWLFNYLYPGQLQNTIGDVYGNYWKQPGDESKYPRLWAGTATNTTTNLLRDTYPLSTAALRDVFYVRLKNISLSYNLPVELISKFKMNKASVFVRGQNVLTWTSEDLFKDPETVTFRGGGIMLKTWSAGLQFSF